MRSIDAATVRRMLPWKALVESLREGFRRGCETPLRHHHGLPVAPGEPPATLLLMPAWLTGEFVGVKIATVFPGNREIGAVQATYVLSDGSSGLPLAAIDGGELTLRRTAAASALAADYLAREDARQLLVVGTGNLAPRLAEAHAAVRPIERVRVWGRSAEKAEATAATLREAGLDATAAESLEQAVRESDVVSCATLATAPLVRGEWLQSGAHLDLVGAFTPEMRESDDEAVRRADVWVDTREGALSEAGDLLQPIDSGAWSADRIRGDLFELARGAVEGRSAADQITLFKSVGTALEDLFAAILLWRRCGG